MLKKNGRLVVEKVKITNSDLSATGAVASIIKKKQYMKNSKVATNVQFGKKTR